MNEKDCAVLEAIPRPEAIRARLSRLARERALLRDLLRLSTRKEELHQTDGREKATA